MRFETDNLFFMLAEYLQRIETNAENELTQIYNNLSIRNANSFDHFELLQAHTKNDTTQQIVREIWILLANCIKK